MKFLEPAFKETLLGAITQFEDKTGGDGNIKIKAGYMPRAVVEAQEPEPYVIWVENEHAVHHKLPISPTKPQVLMPSISVLPSVAVSLDIIAPNGTSVPYTTQSPYFYLWRWWMEILQNNNLLPQKNSIKWRPHLLTQRKEMVMASFQLWLREGLNAKIEITGVPDLATMGVIKNLFSLLPIDPLKPIQKGFKPLSMEAHPQIPVEAWNIAWRAYVAKIWK